MQVVRALRAFQAHGGHDPPRQSLARECEHEADDERAERDAGVAQIVVDDGEARDAGDEDIAQKDLHAQRVGSVQEEDERECAQHTEHDETGGENAADAIGRLGHAHTSDAFERITVSIHSIPEQIALREHAAFFKVGERFIDAGEDLRRGFGDEGRGVFLRFPDDVDLFGVLEGVLQFALDAGGEAGDAAGEFGDVRADHVGLIDEFEIAHVDLAVDIACDVEHFAHADAHGLRAFLAAEGVGGDFDPVLSIARCFDGAVEQEFLIDIAGVEGNEVLGEFRAEVIDLGEHIGHIDDMAHGEGGVDLAHVAARDEAERGFVGVLLPAAAEDVERVVAAERLGEQFGGEDFFFAPDHAVFEGGVDIVLCVQAVVDDFDVVDEADEHVGFELVHLVEVERAEEAVPPAEGAVGIDDDVGMGVGRCGGGDDVLERGAAEGVESREGEVENAPRADIRRFGVHHVADVKGLDARAALAGDAGDGIKVGLLVHTDLAGDDRTHVSCSNNAGTGRWRHSTDGQYRGWWCTRHNGAMC